MSKSVPISLKRKDPLQAFVEAGEEPRASDLTRAAQIKEQDTGKEETVRLTLDLPRGLHRKLKMHVAGEGITIADFLRDILNERLP